MGEKFACNHGARKARYIRQDVYERVRPSPGHEPIEHSARTLAPVREFRYEAFRRILRAFVGMAVQWVSVGNRGVMRLRLITVLAFRGNGSSVQSPTFGHGPCPSGCSLLPPAENADGAFAGTRHWRTAHSALRRPLPLLA